MEHSVRVPQPQKNAWQKGLFLFFEALNYQRFSKGLDNQIHGKTKYQGKLSGRSSDSH